MEPYTGREINLARLRTETFDVAVIGGGIVGAAIARDAAMRGLKAAVATAVCAGLILYDLFARTSSFERQRRLGRNEVRAAEAALEPEGLAGGAVYLDAHGDDARITLENVLDAAYHGAAAANYMMVEGFARSGHRIAALFARNIETGAPFEIRVRVVVDAAGAWATK
jgi:glycerol-3-phosphate dehydrogenase